MRTRRTGAAVPPAGSGGAPASSATWFARMNGAAAGVVAGTVGTVVAGVLVSLLTRETEGWINAVPVWLLRLARRRVPSSHRDILWSEWSAELHAALHSTEDR